jgi:hypothetical protein
MSQIPATETVHDALVQIFGDLDTWFERPWEELRVRPDLPDAWTPAEHLEHVGLVNHYLLLTIGKGCAKALRRAAQLPIPEGQSPLAPLSPLADPDAFHWSPPSHMLPTGRLELAEVRSQLQEQRRRCLGLLGDMPHGEGRLCMIRMSVLDLGRLDMYQWLYFLTQHGRYHLALLRDREG